MPPGRILCVTSNYPRWEGDSTTPFVLHLAQDLQALGWVIDVLAPHAPAAATRERLHGVHVERFRYLWPAALETVCYHGGALINLRQHPTNKVKVPALVAAEWGATAWRLLRRYDLLHTHWILPQGFTGVLAARPLGIPHVATVHGGDVFALNSRVFRPFKRFVLRHADAVTVNSSATEQEVRALLPGIRALHRIPMGASTVFPSQTPCEATTVRQRYRHGHGPLLVFMGRLVWEKGVGDFIRLVARVQPRLPGITAVVVGDGQDRTAMEALSKELGLTECVTFTGWVSPEQVPVYLAAGDICVFPSRRAPDGWVEAQGLAVIEALLARTPVIATRVGGIPDTIRHEHTGLLVEEGDVEAMATAVCRLVANPGLAARLCQAGYADAHTRFARQASAQAFSRLFEQLLYSAATEKLS
jgi:phosphatidylinositol alpha-1,6-mannosyltransferase